MEEFKKSKELLQVPVKEYDVKSLLYTWKVFDDTHIYELKVNKVFPPNSGDKIAQAIENVLNDVGMKYYDQTGKEVVNPKPENVDTGKDWELVDMKHYEGNGIHPFIEKTCFNPTHPPCTIWSVRRKDGEVFTVGDKIGWGIHDSYESTLTAFEIQDGRLKFNDTERPEHCKWADFLNALKLHKKTTKPATPHPSTPVLFTEEDMKMSFNAGREQWRENQNVNYRYVDFDYWNMCFKPKNKNNKA